MTDDEKQKRAEEIATKLSDNNLWHSHGRMIGMEKLRKELRLEIEDYGLVQEQREAIRRYSDTLTGYLERQGISMFVYNRHIH